MDWILSMEVDFLGSVWIKQLLVARAIPGGFMLKLGGYKKVTTFQHTLFYLLYCNHEKGSDERTLQCSNRRLTTPLKNCLGLLSEC